MTALNPVDIIGTHLPRRAAPFFTDIRWRQPVPADERKAYLTFDDGPHPSVTPRLLALLAAYDARATFFVVGRQARAHPDLVRSIRTAGHQIGNHSYAHRDPWLASSRTTLRDLERTRELLHELRAGPTPWVRPPYGHFTRAMRRWCRCRSHQLVMWDLMPGDFLPWATPEGLSRRIFNLIRPGSIIVLHDNPNVKRVTPPALEMTLRHLTTRGWRFPPLEAPPPGGAPATAASHE